jgi:hypothetical protein
VIKRLSSVLRASTAVVLIASFAAGRPAMMACMTEMPHGMEHAAHHQGAQHHAVLLDCCRLCVRACPTTPALPAATAALAPHGRIESAHPTPDRVGFVVLAAPHRLPFSIGPPLHLA